MAPQGADRFAGQLLGTHRRCPVGIGPFRGFGVGPTGSPIPVLRSPRDRIRRGNSPQWMGSSAPAARGRAALSTAGAAPVTSRSVTGSASPSGPPPRARRRLRPGAPGQGGGIGQIGHLGGAHRDTVPRLARTAGIGAPHIVLGIQGADVDVRGAFRATPNGDKDASRRHRAAQFLSPFDGTAIETYGSSVDATVGRPCGRGLHAVNPPVMPALPADRGIAEPRSAGPAIPPLANPLSNRTPPAFEWFPARRSFSPGVCAPRPGTWRRQTTRALREARS